MAPDFLAAEIFTAIAQILGLEPIPSQTFIGDFKRQPPRVAHHKLCEFALH